MAEIVRLTQVKQPTVSNWRRRHPDTFPRAERQHGHEVFVASEVAAWLDGRRIARDDLLEGESVGTTYGTRFRRNGGAPEASTAEPASGRPDPADARVSQMIWLLADRLRGQVPPSTYAERVLSLLYLKIREPAMWRLVRRAAGRDHTGDSVAGMVGYEWSNRGADRLKHQLWTWIRSATYADGDLSDHVLELIDDIHTYVGRPAAETEDAQLFSLLLDRFARQSPRSGEFYTPSAVVDLMADLVASGPSGSIYDPCCGSGELLVGAAERIRRRGGSEGTMCAFGAALSESSWRMAGMHLNVHGYAADLGRQAMNALEVDQHIHRQFDVIVCNPPFNMSHWGDEDAIRDARWEYGEPPQGCANFAWLQHALAKLRPGGRAAVLMTNNASTSRHDKELAIRTAMVQRGAVEGLIALPPQLFYTTNIPVMLWLLRKPTTKPANQVLFVDATSMGTMVDRRVRTLQADEVEQITRAVRRWRQHQEDAHWETDVEFASVLPLSKIADNGYALSPRMYVSGPRRPTDTVEAVEVSRSFDGELAEMRSRAAVTASHASNRLAAVYASTARPALWSESSKWTNVRLGAVCEVTPGPSGTVVRPRGAFEAGVPMVAPKCIRGNRIRSDNLLWVTDDSAAKLQRFRLAEGDIVCVRSGEPGRYARVSADQEGWLLGTGCLRLRPKDVTVGRYLNHYLDHPAARDWVDRNSSGSALRSISAGTLARLPVMVPRDGFASNKIDELLAALDALAADAEIHEQMSRRRAEQRYRLLRLLNPVEPAT